VGCSRTRLALLLRPEGAGLERAGLVIWSQPGTVGWVAARQRASGREGQIEGKPSGARASEPSERQQEPGRLAAPARRATVRRGGRTYWTGRALSWTMGALTGALRAEAKERLPNGQVGLEAGASR